MTDSPTLGHYLRRERECRGLTLRTISENTKVSLSLLEGLETDDISRWPGGIFRRAFVRSYAQCVGLDADDVIRRFDRQFPPDGAEQGDSSDGIDAAGQPLAPLPSSHHGVSEMGPTRARLLGTAADLTVAIVLAFGCAAAGSRLLWPVLLIALYYAGGVVLTGTSPMVALLASGRAPVPPPGRPRAREPLSRMPSPAEVSSRLVVRHSSRRADESAVGQRPGMQAPV